MDGLCKDKTDPEELYELDTIVGVGYANIQNSP